MAAGPPELTLADLRREYEALERLQARQAQEGTRLEEENEFLREQLALALAGGRERTCLLQRWAARTHG